MLCGMLNWPGVSPGWIQDLSQTPVLSALAMRQLTSPQLMDVLPASGDGKSLVELRGAGAVSGAGAVAAREDEDVAFGIGGDADGFTEMGVGRELQKIGVGLVADFGRLLG